MPGGSYCPEHQREAVDPDMKLPFIRPGAGSIGGRRG